jgi:uncharacterized circularly permuted ATP-grasp superfamily protein
MKTLFKLTGRVIYELYDENRQLKERRIVPNMLVTNGRNYLSVFLAIQNHSSYFMQYIGLGSDVTPVTPSDVSLVSELPTRVAGVVSATLGVWQVVSTFNPGVNTGTINEAGLFSDATGGVMMARQVSGIMTKGPLDELVVTWQIAFS